MRNLTVVVCSVLFAGLAWAQPSPVVEKKPATPEALKAEKETRYLAFQIFTYGPDPKRATMGAGTNPQPARFPDKAVLRDYIGDIKRRIGAVGGQQTRLAGRRSRSLSWRHGSSRTTPSIRRILEARLAEEARGGRL